MTKKAIFGGTFDPIHNGHLNIAYEALYSLNLDGIMFMPSGNPPHKINKHITNANLRYEMVKMAVREEKLFEVNSYEIDKKGVSYTYETVRYFKNLEPETKWYFLAGADCLIDIEKWKNTKDILKNCSLIIFNREGYDYKEIVIKKEELERNFQGEVIIIKSPLLEISSTDVRERIKKGENVSYLIPKSVWHTVKSLNLYD